MPGVRGGFVESSIVTSHRYRLPTHWTLWVWVHLEPDEQFDTFKALVDFTDDILRQRLDEQESSARQMAAKYREEDPDSIVSLIVEGEPDRVRETLGTYRRHLTYGLVSGLNALLEASMIQLCRGIAELEDRWHEREAPRKAVLEWFKNFMRRTLHLVVPTDVPEWNGVTRLNMLRHVITHAEGRPNHSLLAFARSHPEYLTVADDGRVDVSPEFLRQAAQDIIALFTEIRRQNADRFTTGNHDDDLVLRNHLLTG